MGLKEFLSQRVIHPALRSMAPGGRAIGPHFAAGLAARGRLEALGPEQRQAFALGELRRLVRHAGASVPYYRELFRSVGFDPRADFSFEDYARLPALEKETVLARREELVAESVDRSRLIADATGGSTGTPVKIYKDVSEKGWGWSGSEYFERRIGGGEGRRVVRIWGHHLDLRGVDRPRKRLRLWLTNVHYLDCFRVSPAIFADWHRFLSRYRPEVLVCYASAIYLYADWLRREGIRPDYPSRAILTGAEKLWPQQRAVVERVFGAPVFERYGGREIGLIAFQAAAGEPALRVDQANVLVEPAEPAGAEGMSEILITKLHSYGMPLLRYRNGDLGRFPTGTRPGHPAELLLEVSGRTMDRILTSDGRVIHAVQFPHMFKDHDVQLFQVHQRPDYSVTVRILPGPAFGPADLERIRALCAANLGPTPLQIELTDQLERTRAGKLRPVISEAVEHTWGTADAATTAD